MRGIQEALIAHVVTQSASLISFLHELSNEKTGQKMSDIDTYIKKKEGKVKRSIGQFALLVSRMLPVSAVLKVQECQLT